MNYAVACGLCGVGMDLIHGGHAVGSDVAIRHYCCPECKHWATLSVEQVYMTPPGGIIVTEEQR